MDFSLGPSLITKCKFVCNTKVVANEDILTKI